MYSCTKTYQYQSKTNVRLIELFSCIKWDTLNKVRFPALKTTKSQKIVSSLHSRRGCRNISQKSGDLE